MSRYEVVSRRMYNEGYLKGVELQPEPVLGPEIASAIWAQNNFVLGQINYTPHWKFFVHEHHLACFGPKNCMREAI